MNHLLQKSIDTTKKMVKSIRRLGRFQLPELARHSGCSLTSCKRLAKHLNELEILEKTVINQRLVIWRLKDRKAFAAMNFDVPICDVRDKEIVKDITRGIFQVWGIKKADIKLPKRIHRSFDFVAD